MNSTINKNTMLKKILLSLLLLGLPGFGLAIEGTVVDVDIVQNTVWTKDMSPIIIRWKDEKVDKIRVIDWATLTIEPWVKVVFWPHMSLVITNQCKRWYLEDCHKDTLWKSYFPKVIAKWTDLLPIIFTSKDDYQNTNPQPWDWWNVIVASMGNDFEYVHFKYWWSKEFDYFIDLRRDTVFKNNIIENINNNAIYFAKWDFVWNAISNVNGNAILCERNCNIRGNSIIKAQWYAIKANPEFDTLIESNFIAENDWYWFILDYYFTQGLKIKNNYFLHNLGWIKLYHNNLKVDIEWNNLEFNKDFAISSETYSWSWVVTKNNWFNIDSWPKQEAWEYYVSPGFDTTDFSSQFVPFGMDSTSPAWKYFQRLQNGKKADSKFINTSIKREAIIWKLNLPWSIVHYTSKIENMKSIKISQIAVEYSLPLDQDISLCSFVEGEMSNYDYKEQCKELRNNQIKVFGSKIVWNIWDMTALSTKTLNFVWIINSSYSWSWEAKNPELSLQEGDNTFNINYSYWDMINIEKWTWSLIKQWTGIVVNTPKAKSKSKPKVATKAPVAKVSKQTESTNQYLEIGYIWIKQNPNSVDFILTTPKWVVYKLFNSKDWPALRAHLKWPNAKSLVWVKGEYFVTKWWHKIGINYTSFWVMANPK